MKEEITTIKRTKKEVTIEDLKKIQELTQQMKDVKKALIKLMKKKEKISREMYELEDDGYCDIDIFDGEIVDSYNTLPQFEEATEEYEQIMRDTADFWLDGIHNIKD